MRDLRELHFADEECSRSRRIAAQRCTVPGCGKIGRGKPWCESHVLEHSPYARKIHRQVCRRNAAQARSLATEDMLADARQAMADHGQITVQRLARVLHVSIETALKVSLTLVRAGEARFGRTRRGAQTVVAA